MYKGRSSRIFPILVILVIVAIAVVALVSVGRVIFGGGSNTADKTEIDTSRQALLDTALNHSVRMTVRGPIVASEDFESYQITVSPENRKITQFAGYLGQSLQSKQFDNNSKAYEEFVYALDKANMMRGRELKDEANDTRGICAKGDLYEFEVLKDNSVVKKLWTSTCRGSKGSLNADLSQVRNLFTDQIPKKSDILNDIDL